MFSLDRLENGNAVLIDENGISITVNDNLLPENIKEGDIVFDLNGKYYIDVTITKQKQEENKKKLEKIISKSR